MYSYIFDIGGVLINYDCKRVVEILAERTGCECGTIEQLFQYEYIYAVETGRVSCKDFYENSILRAMPDISYKDWIGAFADHYTVNAYGMDLLMQLKKEGKDVYILSNLAEFHKIAIEEKVPGFFDLGKDNFFSYVLGYHKPEISIYKEVCKAIGKRPEECVFFDDIQANIEGAIKAGMIGIHFSNDNIEEIRQKVLAL